MRLRNLRNESNLTQKKIAEMLNVTVSTFSHWECDYQEPSFKDLISIGKFFNVSTDYLLGLEDDFGSRVTGEGNQLEAAAMYTDKEIDLIEAFRKLMPETQDFILRTVRSLHDNRDKIDLK